ncbi:hypothetical protein LMG29542_01065 [Paraburkholderia humisilvae]|uniref:Uncharacterized protein n=1 Tax=Paraburkholderia humisilvae TaxID=627669 RepID=A0A6J5D603_9BURK|nr:hypothetical protein LMG29542_01065 [Paraburkholderia humisilvae]
MPYSWKEVAEAWCVTLDDFLGTHGSSLADFDPFERISREVQWFSIDPFAAAPLPGESGLTVHLLKSTAPHLRLTSVLMKDGARAGFVARRQEGCDIVSLAPDLRGKGLSPDLLLATRVLRATLKYSDVMDLRSASKQLFCGGSYSCAGLASARAAHRLAVTRAVAKGKAIPATVLAHYARHPELPPGQKPPDCSVTPFHPRRRAALRPMFRTRRHRQTPRPCGPSPIRNAYASRLRSRSGCPSTTGRPNC